MKTPSFATVACIVATQLCIPPLLMLLTMVTGVKLGAVSVLAIWFACLAANFGLMISAQREHTHTPSWFSPIATFVIIAALCIKLYTIRELEYGYWGDSLQHTIISQLLVDNGGLFQSWAPYAPLATFTYHFGFHANVAVFHWMTGLPVPRSTVVVGQLMQVAGMLSAGALAKALVDHAGRQRKTPDSAVVAICSMLFLGFINLTPMFLPNWGRYTQLAGQALMPAVLLSFHQLATTRQTQKRLVLISAVMTTGLALTHYLVAVMTAVLVCGLLFSHFYSTPRKGHTIMFRYASVAGLAGIAIAPWIMIVLGSKMLSLDAGPLAVSAAANTVQIVDASRLEPLTPFFIKPGFLWLAMLGVLVSLFHRARLVTLCGIWAICLMLLITPQTIGLPGTGIIDYLTAYLAIPIVLAPAAGYAIAMMISLLRRIKWWNSLPLGPMVATCSVLVIGWSASWQPSVLNPASHQLLANGDVMAMNWIRENLPQQATIWTNRFPAYGGNLVAGNDGGWWAQYLTLREAQLPPLNYGTELAGRPGYLSEVNDLSAKVRDKSLFDPSVIQIDITRSGAFEELSAAGITHVYLGATRAPGNSDTILIPLRDGADKYMRIFESAGVQVYALKAK